MTKTLNDVAVGDKVLAMGAKTFTAPLTVQKITRFGGSVVMVNLSNGAFWPLHAGQAAQTQITVA